MQSKKGGRSVNNGPLYEEIKLNLTCGYNSNIYESINQLYLIKSNNNFGAESSIIQNEVFQGQDDEEDSNRGHQSISSLFQQIRDINSQTSGYRQFILRTYEIFTRTAAATGLFVVLSLFHVAMILIGLRNLNDCLIQPQIPVYVLVSGCFGLVKIVSHAWQLHTTGRYDGNNMPSADVIAHESTNCKSSRFTETVLSLFLFVWFVCGNYWVLSVWMPEFHMTIEEPNHWCNKTIYISAVGQILFFYCFLGVWFLVSCALVTYRTATSIIVIT